MDKKKLKHGIAYTVIILISLYISFIISNLIFPKYQIFIDLQDYLVDDKVLIGVHGQDLVEYETLDGKVDYTLKILDEDYNLKFNIEKGEVKSLTINDKEWNNLVKISTYTTNAYYKDTYCIKLNKTSIKHYISFGVFTIIFVIILYLIYKSLFDKGKHYKLIYSSSSIKAIGKKPIIISFVVAILSMVLYVGCDLNVISESVIMYVKGIDFYQMFSCLNHYKGISLLMWQYDSGMLLGYSIPAYITYPLLRFFNPSGYHWVQVFEYKIFNMVLINLLVLSVISFLIDKKILKKEKAKKIYYVSVFNPLTFYVAEWFLQFDMLPAYLITLGILLMDNLNENKYLSGLLIGLALSCKMTMWMFIPSILILEVYLLLKDKRLLAQLKQSFVIIVVVGIMLICSRVFNSPIASALSGLDQSERIWFTAFPYLSGVYLYIAILGLVSTFMLNYHDVSLKISKANMILITILSFGAITMVFSFGTVSTPSFWLQTMGAFIILFTIKDDNLTLALIMCFAALVALQYACLPEGDITASLYFFDMKPIFTVIKDKAILMGSFEKYQSLLFTISQAAMFSFTIIFSKLLNKFKSERNILDKVKEKSSIC